MYNELTQALAKDAANYTHKMVGDLYDTSKRIRVAFNFVKDLIAKESVIINKHSKYLLNNNMSANNIYDIIFSRIQDNLKWIND